ncbi:MAG: 50S ribosomal protein L11 methyltransferase [Acidobacteriia bacterium]|nr:50S ribosomal protein L11 methyltransferase [Terriglobia bacterium]
MRHETPWIAIVLEAPSGLEEELAADLGASSLGVEAAPAGSGTVRLRIYLPGAQDPGPVLGRTARALRAHGVDPSNCELGVEGVEDGRWVERYQASLRPLPLGDRFVVIPNGIASPGIGRDPILLVPGRAFGTGEHPTTRLCAAALERYVRPGSRWLDLGTGSGILAVVAARCGAGVVEAVDDDDDAVDVAREVVEANGAASRVRIRAGSADLLAGAALDGCVANVATRYFVERAAEVAAVLGVSGVLLCSGLLGDDADQVSRVLRVAGLETVERRDEGPWCLLVSRRGAAS